MGREAWRRWLWEAKGDPLLREAFTHASYANEHPGLRDNERLEFLGDAVLGLIASLMLFDRFPERSEGELSRWRAALVCEASLARIAADLDLGSHLQVGRGDALSGVATLPSVLADAFEALVGAVYLSYGWEKAVALVRDCLEPEVEALAQGGIVTDAKTALQEAAQRKGLTVQYELLDSSGPDHRKVFTVRVCVGGRDAGVGRGLSKKEAEQAAAREALARTDLWT